MFRNSKSTGIRRFVDFQYYCCNLQIRARNSTNLALRGKWECHVLNTVAVQKGLHLAQEAQHSRLARSAPHAEDSGRHRTSLLYAPGAMSPQNGVIASKAKAYPFDDSRSQGCLHLHSALRNKLWRFRDEKGTREASSGKRSIIESAKNVHHRTRIKKSRFAVQDILHEFIDPSLSPAIATSAKRGGSATAEKQKRAQGVLAEHSKSGSSGRLFRMLSEKTCIRRFLSRSTAVSKGSQRSIGFPRNSFRGIFAALRAMATTRRARRKASWRNLPKAMPGKTLPARATLNSTVRQLQIRNSMGSAGSAPPPPTNLRKRGFQSPRSQARSKHDQGISFRALWLRKKHQGKAR